MNTKAIPMVLAVALFTGCAGDDDDDNADDVDAEGEVLSSEEALAAKNRAPIKECGAISIGFPSTSRRA